MFSTTLDTATYTYLSKIKYIPHCRIDNPREPVLIKVSSKSVNGREFCLTGKEYIAFISQGMWMFYETTVNRQFKIWRGSSYH